MEEEKKIEFKLFVDKNGNVWFKAKELAAHMNFSNTSNIIRKYIYCKDKCTIKDFLKNNPNYIMDPSLINIKPNTVLINCRGLSCLIQNSKMEEIQLKINIINYFNKNFDGLLSTRLLRISNKNTNISIIKNTFHNYKSVMYYKVKNHRVDLFFIDLKVVVEFAEFDCMYDDNNICIDNIYKQRERELEIISILNCRFFIFNPDVKNFCIYKTIGDLFEFLFK